MAKGPRSSKPTDVRGRSVPADLAHHPQDAAQPLGRDHCPGRRGHRPAVELVGDVVLGEAAMRLSGEHVEYIFSIITQPQCSLRCVWSFRDHL